MSSWNLPLPLLLDGATATMLQQQGMPREANTAQWVLQHPDQLVQLQRRYVAAGCDVLYTATFDANRAALDQRGEQSSVAKINRELVELSKKAAGKQTKIAGCLSPVGMNEYWTERNPDLTPMIAIFREQAEALAEAGVDFLVCESMQTLCQARAALLGARSTGLPVAVTFSVNEQGKTITGGRLLPAVITLQSMGAAAIGLDCSHGPAAMLRPLKKALSHAAVPLVAKPSVICGETELSPLQFAEEMKKLMDTGAVLVGGCCGAKPEHMAVLRGVVDTHEVVISREIDDHAVANDKEAFFLAEDLYSSPILDCNSRLADNLIDAEDTYNVARVEIACEEDIGEFLEAAEVCRLPLAVYTNTPALLENVLVRYNGRLMVDSVCDMERKELEEIAARYGAVVY